METELKAQELLSALADGELEGEELAQALALCTQDASRASWHTYHLIGDVLRSPELARASDSERLLLRLRTELAQSPAQSTTASSDIPISAEPVVRVPGSSAANDSIWRWKLVAGFASMAAVAAIGWNSLSVLRGEQPQAAQLAAAAPPAASAPTELAQAGAPVMIRDPRLDELLAAHKQFGGASALQMPAGFLRNATFEAPER
ncbi:sigma-E factor negative regulatory protein [Simplicispira suum]|uniref:Anti-anti-sigma factor n=1 Tax=Simplicispira suum TaxID=2109915 RepID=A0A2S0N515_9BURK|nr:sigma-E factor negative regulatory protein [Simplicispira suum]AVO43033.1 anti-anti-sigma factor [Simplicispira suum]MBW7834507.1 sigma-E factor negative regulatory protein [Simplicispira suum]